jgi:hypothetical protein
MRKYIKGSNNGLTEVLYEYFPAGTEESNENPQSGQSVSGKGFTWTPEYIPKIYHLQ